MHTKYWSESLNRRDHSDDLGVGESFMLERILGKYGGEVRTGLIWLWVRTNAVCCEHVVKFRVP